MLYPTAGSRLFIANLPSRTPYDVAGSDWTEIGETEALGMLGVEWRLVDTTHMGSCDPDGGPVEEVVKGVMARRPMQVILGNDPTDPGQSILWSASRSREAFPFRLMFPDGATSRSWSALITSLSEVFDVANAVMRLQADLRPVSEIYRSEVA